MKVKDLIKLLKNTNPESTVLVRVDGSIYPTDNVDEHQDYNHDNDQPTYYILTLGDVK